MLSCDRVLELLPGLVTGEPTSHEVREHLASCDACRAERDRLAADIADIREDLAALAPSPFLEDAVVDAAHETEGAERPRRPWRYVATAFVAAAALFLVVLLPRLQQGGGEEPAALPGGEGEGELVASAASVFVPLSPGEVAKARRWNERALSLQGATLEERFAVETQVEGGVEFVSTSETWPTTEPGAMHRWVYGDEQGQPGARTHTMATLPSVEGVFYMGAGLLEEIGGTLHAGATGEIIVGDKRWSTTPGTMQGELTVSSPDAGGATAQVRVLVSTGYSGTLLLEEPLAYALGLHQFEVPGEVEFKTPNGQNIPVHGWRARARVAIPDLDFDRVVEVQVVRARPWMVKRGRRSRKTGLLFRGLIPTSGVQAEKLVFDEAAGELALVGKVRGWSRGEGGDSRQENVEVEPGTFRFVFVFQPPQGNAVPMLPDLPLLGELFQGTDGVLIPQALDFHASTLHVIDISRVNLKGKWEPGAAVTIARVWRGRTAIPSAEAVVRTEVAESGRLTFPRIAGELGSTLRMLVTAKDGTSTFHDVVVAPELRTTPQLDLSLGADGIVAGPGWTVALLDGPWEGDEATGAPGPERLAALIEQLQWHAGKPAQRDADGNSRTVLALHAGRDVPWRMVQWLMMAASDPRVRIRKITFFAMGAQGPVREPIRIPTDEGIGAVSPVRIIVALTRKTVGGPLEIRCGPEGGPHVAVTWEELPGRLGDALTKVEGESTGLVGLVKVPPPGLVTSPEAARVMTAFREAGFEDIQFEGAPLR